MADAPPKQRKAPGGRPPERILSAFEHGLDFFEEAGLGKTHVKSGEDVRFQAEVVMPFLREVADILQKRVALPVVQDGRDVAGARFAKR